MKMMITKKLFTRNLLLECEDEISICNNIKILDYFLINQNKENFLI